MNYCATVSRTTSLGKRPQIATQQLTALKLCWHKPGNLPDHELEMMDNDVGQPIIAGFDSTLHELSKTCNI